MFPAPHSPVQGTHRGQGGRNRGPSKAFPTGKGSRGFTKEHQSADLLLVEMVKLLIMRQGRRVEILMCCVGRRLRMCWYSRGAVEHCLPWRVKSPSTLITADPQCPTSQQGEIQLLLIFTTSGTTGSFRKW